MAERATIEQLPRGRHKLSREQVLASQRTRMFRGIGEAVAEKGYAAASVADVIRRAGVSRETFYEQFANKETCFLAAFDSVAELTQARFRDALGAPGDPPLERLARALDAYLADVVAEPQLARAFLVEVYGAGPEAAARRLVSQGAFAELFIDALGVESEEDRFACEALAAAVAGMTSGRLAAGRAAELPGLAPPLLRLAARLLEQR